MSWTQDNTGQLSASTNNPLVLSYTCGAGTTLLVIALASRSNTARTGGTPTYNTTLSFTDSGEGFLGGDESYGVEVWYLLNPPTGSAYDISVPNSAADTITLNVTSWIGTGSPSKDASNSVDSGSGTSTNPSTSVSNSYDNDLALGFVGSGDRDVPSGGSGYTLTNTEDFGNQVYAGEYDLDAGTGSPHTIDFTTSHNEDYVIIGIMFRDAAATATSDSQSAYLAGRDNILDNQFAYAHGQDSTSDNQAAFLQGALGALDNQSAYLAGLNNALDNQTAYLAGVNTAQDNQSAYLSGIAGATDNQSAYLAGTDTASDNQPVYLEGELGANDTQWAFLQGQDTTSAQLSAFLAGKVDTSSVQSAFILGEIVEEPILVHDSFTDSNFTLVKNHTPEIRPNSNAWVNCQFGNPVGDYVEIQNNEAEAVGGFHGVYIDSGEADVTVIAYWTPQVSADNRASLLFRFASDGNGWAVNVREANGDIQFIRYYNDGSSYEIFGNTAWSWTEGQTYQIKVVASGEDFVAYVDGTEATSTTGQTYNRTATNHGIGANAATVNQHWDNFLVTKAPQNNQSAYTQGLDNTLDNRAAYLFGNAEVSDNQAAYLEGGSTEISDSKHAYTKGQDTATDSQSAWLAGGIQTSDNQAAYLAGASTASHMKSAFLYGDIPLPRFSGFETGDTSDFDSEGGTPNINGTAALTGSYGLEVDYVSVDYVEWQWYNTTWGNYRAEFDFNFNNLTGTGGDTIFLYHIYDGVQNCGIIQIVYNTGQWAIRVQMRDDTSTYQIGGVNFVSSGWHHVSADFHYEDTTGYCNVWIDSSPVNGLSGVDSGTWFPDNVRIGHPGGNPMPDSGSVYMDNVWIYDTPLTETSDSQSAFLNGALGASDNQPAYTAGFGPAYGQQSAYTIGSDTALDNQTSYLSGQNTSLDNQSAFTQGQDTALSQLSAFLNGSNVALDNQPSYLQGSQDGTDSSPAYLSGSNTATDNQAAYLQGLDSSLDNQAAFTQGSSSTQGNQAAFLVGSLDTQDNQAAFLFGNVLATDNQAAYMEGFGGVTSALSAYLAGISTAQDNQSAFTQGYIFVQDNQSAYTQGFGGVLGSQSAYLAGVDSTSDTKSAYLSGYDHTTSAIYAYLSGYSQAVSNQEIYLLGSADASDSSQAFVSGEAQISNQAAAFAQGQDSSQASQSAFLTGAAGAASSQSAYTAGFDAQGAAISGFMRGSSTSQSSTAAYMFGGTVATSSVSAFIQAFGGTPTSSVSAYTSGGLGITDIIELESEAPLKFESDSLVTQTLSQDSIVNTQISRDSEL